MTHGSDEQPGTILSFKWRASSVGLTVTGVLNACFKRDDATGTTCEVLHMLLKKDATGIIMLKLSKQCLFGTDSPAKQTSAQSRVWPIPIWDTG